MADVHRIRSLWSGDSFPEENEYEDVQKKHVPQMEDLLRTGRFEAAYNHLRSRCKRSLGDKWELQEMTVGDIVHGLQELNPLPVKYDGHAGYMHVYEMETKLWDFECQPGYGRLFVDRTTIPWACNGDGFKSRTNVVRPCPSI